MDLGTIHTVTLARSRSDLAAMGPADAFLAGGTALYGQPQDHLRRLVDLTTLNWPALTQTAEGLEIAATCTVADLSSTELPSEWRPAQKLITQCCRAFLASFKIWNLATVGGNICMSYPAGPMISLAVALDGEVVVWTPDGGEYRLPVIDFVTGDTTNVLKPGDVLRSVLLPGETLARRTAFRQLALADHARSAVVVIGRDDGDDIRLYLTASTRKPYLVSVPADARDLDLVALIDDMVQDGWMSDVYGAGDWRRHVTGTLATEVLAELSAGALPAAAA